jgi:hypothetical protein
MVFTKALRHLDRGSNEEERGQYNDAEEVVGGTGACLFFTRECLEDLIVPAIPFDMDLAHVYPELCLTKRERAELFDEAFFAYREDADLAWRSRILGWRCLYVPSAIGYHIRRVLPERRGSLPPLLNRLSVRNRFLLQLNNLTSEVGIKALILGVVLRNILVLVAAFTLERSSMQGVREAWTLRRRALSRRKMILEKAEKRKSLGIFL